VIVDAADEMNVAAANAVLKLLEEPPAGAVLLLVCHRPSALLPTIRSRCRVLKCATLQPAALSAALGQAGVDVPTGQETPLAVLSGGSVGAAVQLISGGGTDTYERLVALLVQAPGLNRVTARTFAEAAAPRGQPERVAQTLSLIEIALARIARTGVAGPPEPEAVAGEAAMAQRLCPDARAARHWAAMSGELMSEARRAVALNLDPAAVLLDTLWKIDAGAARVANPGAPVA